MSITYRQGYKLGQDFARKVNKTTAVARRIRAEYKVKLDEYDSLQSELETTSDIESHDSLLSEQTDSKLVRLNQLRDELIALGAQFEILSEV